MKDFTRLDNLLKRFVEEGTNPGCAAAVMQGDELIWHGEAGYADIESGKKVDLHSMFSQASTTKLFTYAILGMIYEEGKFLFSDPLSDYLPEWKNTKKYVTRPNGALSNEKCPVMQDFPLRSVYNGSSINKRKEKVKMKTMKIWRKSRLKKMLHSRELYETQRLKGTKN